MIKPLKTLLYLFLLVPVLYSCKSKEQNNLRILDKLNNTLQHSIQNIANANATIYNALDAKHFKKGKTIEINEGIGSFILPNKTVMIIDGKVMKIQDEIATYKLKVQSQPGKYYIPIKVTFVAEDGREVIKEQSVEYTVDE